MKGQKTNKNSFILYHSYSKHLKRFTDEQVGKLVRCIFHYSETGEMLDLEPLLEVAFDFIKEDIDINREKYEETCRKNKQNVLKRWYTDDTTVYDRIRPDTNDTDNDNDNGSDNENENEDNISKDMEKKSPDEFIEKIQKGLRESYPHTLEGLSDRRRVYNLKQIMTPRKDKDEWMDEEPIKNMERFYKEYSKTDDRFKVRKISKLVEIAKEWRECEGKLK